MQLKAEARRRTESVLSRSVCTASGQAGVAELLHGHCHWGFSGGGAEGLGQVWAHLGFAPDSPNRTELIPWTPSSPRASTAVGALTDTSTPTVAFQVYQECSDFVHVCSTVKLLYTK